MSVITIVRKNGVCAIAADSLTSMGSTKCSRGFQRNDSKIYRVGDSYLGVVGYSAHGHVIESLIERHPGSFDFRSKRHIFEAALKLHSILKEDYLLQTSEGSRGQPYESSQLHFCIANPHGIFVLDSYREVNEYSKFWSIGSGGAHALGAMHAIYNDPDFDAEIIAQQGVATAATFDLYCAEPIDSYAVALKESKKSDSKSRKGKKEKRA